MAAAGGAERVRVSNRSIVIFVGLLGLTLLALRMVAAAGRVIGWMLVAATVAGLLEPAVRALAARGWPRGRAVLVVAAGALLTIGFVTYRVVDDVQRGTRALERAAPEAAALIEANESFGEAARAVKLEERTRTFVEELPERLRGGTPAEAFRAAATRGVAFLTTGVLTLFLLLHGRDLVAAALRQIPGDARRERTERIASVAYEKAFGYARGTLLMAVLAGWVAYAAAYVAGVPGAAPLAVWVGLWDVVPIVGAVVGALPIVVLAAVMEPVRGAVLALVFLAYQVFEDVGMEPYVESRTMRLGPFLTIAAGFAGFELRGLPGALLGVLATALAVAALDEVAPS